MGSAMRIDSVRAMVLRCWNVRRVPVARGSGKFGGIAGGAVVAESPCAGYVTEHEAS